MTRPKSKTKVKQQYKPGLLIASGGIDSVVLAHRLKKQNALAGVAIVNWGQVTYDEQLYTMNHHCVVLETPLYELNVDLSLTMQPAYKKAGHSPKRKWKPEHRDANGDKAVTRYYSNDEYAYVDGRNTLIILQAALQASSLSIPYLYCGFQMESDYWNLPKRERAKKWDDTTPEFVDAINDILYYGWFKNIELICPFFDSQETKEQIVQSGIDMGVDLDATYSCEFFPPCGKCTGCSHVQNMRKKFRSAIGWLPGDLEG